MKKVNIIGAGLTGPLLSIYLSKKGFNVSLYEKRPDCRISSNYNGRSINLALSERGINALKEISLYDNIKDLLIPMGGRMIHRIGESLDFQPYGSNKNECIYSVSRLELNKKLLELSESCGVKIYFDKVLTGYDSDSNNLNFNGEVVENSSPVIGCDGSSSIISDVIASNHGCTKKVDGLGYSYKELTILPTDEGFRLNKNALHIWPRNSFMMIALPNTDKSFTCTLFLPNSGINSFSQNKNKNDVASFFKEHFPDLIHLIPDYIDQYMANPVSSLSTVYLDVWHYKDRACVLGDAAHAIVPFFGQGMNAGFEDCSVINKLLTNFTGDWNKLFSDFYRLRKKNCDSIARMALENFIEMRDHVLNQKYILKKKLSSIIESRHKDRFIPRYSMVSFHSIPYRTVYERGKAQDKILDRLISKYPDINNIDYKYLDRLVEENLEPLYE